MEEPDAGARDRPVLHQLPGPHPLVEAILGDNGFIVNVLQALHLLGQDGRLLATPLAVVAGLTYNFLPFMVLPLYASLEKIDPRLHRGRRRPLRLARSRRSARSRCRCPCPGVVAGTLLTFIPAAGDYINAELLGYTETSDGRQRHPEPVPDAGDYPAAAALSVILMALDRGHGALLHPPRRHGGAGLMASVGRWVGDHLVLSLGLLVLALHVRADLHRHPDVVQRPRVAVRLQLRRVHAAQLAEPLRARRDVRLGAARAPDRVPRHARRHHPRHPDGVRPGAPPVPWPRRRQRAHLPADGLARDRHGLRRCSRSSSQRASAGGSASGRSWSPTSCSACPSWSSRSRRAWPGMDPRLEQAAMDLYADPSADVLAGHLPAGLPRHHRRRAAELLAVLRRLHHHQLQRRHRPSRSRCTSGASPSAGSRCRSTSSAR